MQKHFRAFTLIEVIIVVAISGIVSAITLVSFTAQRSERILERASRELAGALREAQSYALSGRSTSTSQENCWYGVRIPNGSAAYSVVNRSGTTCATSGTIGSYTLKDGVVFSGDAVPTTVAFALPRGGVSAGDNEASLSAVTTDVLIGLSRSGVSYYVCVYSTGRVVERGKTASCT